MTAQRRPAGQSTKKRRVRLLKVIVQPVVVVDDGETLLEQEVRPVVVPAAAWEDFPAQFARDFAQLQARVAGGGDEPASE